MKILALTVIGKDRPGIVQELSTTISDNGGNWLESHMANLAGQFAGIVQLQIPSDNFAAFELALGAMADQGLSVQVAEAAVPETEAQEVRQLHVEVVGRDHPGIVRDLTEAVAKAGGSITNLESDCFSASMSGEEMFKAEMTIALPATVAIVDIETSLLDLSEDIMMDMVVEEAIAVSGLVN